MSFWFHPCHIQYMSPPPPSISKGYPSNGTLCDVHFIFLGLLVKPGGILSRGRGCVAVLKVSTPREWSLLSTDILRAELIPLIWEKAQNVTNAAIDCDINMCNKFQTIVIDCCSKLKANSWKSLAGMNINIENTRQGLYFPTRRSPRRWKVWTWSQVSLAGIWHLIFKWMLSLLKHTTWIVCSVQIWKWQKCKTAVTSQFPLLWRSLMHVHR